MGTTSYEYRAANAEVSHGYLYPVVSRLLEGVPAGAVVVDAGCGNGSFLSLFRNRNWKLSGFDASPTGIEIARNAYPEIAFYLSDGQMISSDLPKLIGQADVVLSTEVIEHIYNPRGFLKSCFELLKPGGVLVITTPYHGYLKNLVLAITGKMDRHFTVLWDHGHIKFWSRQTLEQVLGETGFTDIEFAGAGRIPYLWKSMALKARKPV